MTYLLNKKINKPKAELFFLKILRFESVLAPVAGCRGGHLIEAFSYLMSSDHAEDTCYRFICELGGGAPRAEKGTDDRE